MKQLADNELEDTYAMRESLFVCREKARNILHAQQDRTEHTIRKRLFETQRGRNELEWQMLKVYLIIINCDLVAYIIKSAQRSDQGRNGKVYWRNWSIGAGTARQE